ncbi:MAG: glycoside hydrolase family 3 C-terminal domain-containing protein [Anaerolineaceae bacterium]|nr:glycoside hydrolase family 3 C-terminal domain-containing protein [Anaerolineaceae bacterium]
MTDTSDLEPLYLNPDARPKDRARDLISRMTLAEKVSSVLDDSVAVERLGIPAYNWWNEALHGVARAGKATVFPQAIGIAATWNGDLVQQLANAISDEARAKHHEALRKGEHSRYTGLTMWSPNVNIFRDPRWGRGQETYGEDPHLTSRLSLAYVRGLQGDHPDYLKTAACAKHYVAYSGPEATRHEFNAQVSARDFKMTYLPAFEALVKEGEVAGVMGAYNRVNGEACCASPYLLQYVLRRELGFRGYIVSDCGAIKDIYAHHHLVDTPEEAAAKSVKAGCDLNCGCTYENLFGALGNGLILERDIDRALVNLFELRFRLGMFDSDDQVPYAQIPVEVVASPANQALALEVARQSLVLLKNEGNLLPLGKDLKRVAVIGPNADDELVLRGNYYGTPTQSVTVLEGIRSILPGQTEVEHEPGCDILGTDKKGIKAAVKLAKKSDLAIVVLGLSQLVEGEEGQREGVAEGLQSKGDRADLALPGMQQALLEAVAETGTPVVLVLLNGSALAVNWAQEHIPAILEAWYPGEAGGRAVAEALFGDYNPGGRLPVTFYQSVDQLPPYEDYAMQGRTYRYFAGDVLYPFGFGLSYTSFEYSELALNFNRMDAPDTLEISCVVRNTGQLMGDEVVQVYLRDEEASLPIPRHSLVAFKRVRLGPGGEQRVTLSVPPRAFALVDGEGSWVIEPGNFTVFIGGGQPGYAETLHAQVQVVGKTIRLD